MSLSQMCEIYDTLSLAGLNWTTRTSHCPAYFGIQLRRFYKKLLLRYDALAQAM